MPRNADDSDAHFFEPHLSYTLDHLKLKRLKNVFVANCGLAMNRNGLIKESHHSYPGHLKDYLKEASAWYHDADEDPEKLIILDDDNTYLLVHHPWFMYYHWLCESIFRVWMVKDAIGTLTLILPEEYKNYDFVMSSLEPFVFKSIYYIARGKSLLVRNIWIPQIKTKLESYDQAALIEVRNFYIHLAARVKKINKNLGEKIYISRSKAGRRKVINEDGVVAVLLKYNFVIVNNEDYSFFEQVSIYSHARCLVSIHGSGLTNMIFMEPFSTVLEFHKKQTKQSDWHSLAFWYLADALKHNYYHQVCEPANDNDDFFIADFMVDIELLEKNLRKMQSSHHLYD